MSRKWLKRAHYDENKVVDDFWKKGYPALRLPISGAGRFKSDVLAFTPHCIKLVLIRRSESEEKIVFEEREIKDVMSLAGKISELTFPVGVEVVYHVHFPKQRKWKSGTLSYGRWKGGNVEVREE